jgi:hypothetical protein
VDSFEHPTPAAAKRHAHAFHWVYAIALLLAFAVLGVGIYRVALHPDEWTMLAVGAACVILVGVTWPLAIVAGSARPVAGGGAGMSNDGVQSLIERLDQIALMLNLMSEQQLLSDRGKMIAFRDKDREAFRRAIGEESARGDWDAAFALTGEIERTFGKAEADRLREEVNRRRSDTVRRAVAECMTTIDRHTRGEQWSAALRECERLAQLYPDNEQVRALPAEIDRRRQAHKQRLLDSWHEAVARHDVDGSIEILKQLDPYLTPAEGATMQETARGVFKEKLTNLGKQFAQAVHDQRWRDAIQLGDGIQREFPNSRMAQEVREKMDDLRRRAAGLEAAPA